MLSNSRALATTGGGQRVILARSRVLSRCHSGFAGVLKRDSDFLFSLCASLFPWWFWLPRRDYNRLLAPLPGARGSHARRSAPSLSGHGSEWPVTIKKFSTILACDSGRTGARRSREQDCAGIALISLCDSDVNPIHIAVAS